MVDSEVRRVAVFSPFSIATLEYPWWFIKERGLFWLMVGSGNLRSKSCICSWQSPEVTQNIHARGHMSEKTQLSKKKKVSTLIIY